MTRHFLISIISCSLLCIACKKKGGTDNGGSQNHDTLAEVLIVNELDTPMHFDCYRSAEDFAGSSHPYFTAVIPPHEHASFNAHADRQYYTEVYSKDYIRDNWRYENLVTSRESNLAPLVLWPYGNGVGDNTYFISEGSLEGPETPGYRHYYLAGNQPYTLWRAVGQNIYDPLVVFNWRDSTITEAEKGLTLKLTKGFEAILSGYGPELVYAYRPRKGAAGAEKWADLLGDANIVAGRVTMDAGVPYPYRPDTCYLYYGGKTGTRRYVMARQH